MNTVYILSENKKINSLHWACKTVSFYPKGEDIMKLIYDVESKPKLHQLIVFSFQQVLAIMAATIAVPLIIGNGMNTAAALFVAWVGTLDVS